MKTFEYYKPSSLGDALSILDKYGPEAKVLAGGTDLIIQMKKGTVVPAAVIDVKGIPELNRLEWDGNTLYIGAAVPLSKIIAYPQITEKFNILNQACSIMASRQLRNRATIGGNICNAAPSADSAPPLICLKARAVVASRDGNRTITLEKFFLGPGKTVLTEKELLVAVEVPAAPPFSSGCYLRHIPRQDMDIAVVGVGSYLVCDKQNYSCLEARIALGAVAPTPVRAFHAETFLKGKVLTAETIEQAAEQSIQDAVPISDIRGSVDYRRELVRVLTKRTLLKALETLNNCHDATASPTNNENTPR